MVSLEKAMRDPAGIATLLYDYDHDYFSKMSKKEFKAWKKRQKENLIEGCNLKITVPKEQKKEVLRQISMRWQAECGRI